MKLEQVQRQLVSVLLDRIRSLGLISDSTCGRAVDLVHSMDSFPSFFQYPVCLTEEASGFECAPGTP